MIKVKKEEGKTNKNIKLKKLNLKKLNKGIINKIYKRRKKLMN